MSGKKFLVNVCTSGFGISSSGTKCAIICGKPSSSQIDATISKKVI